MQQILEGTMEGDVIRVKPPRRTETKHQASKPDFKHRAQKPVAKRLRQVGATNHERVVAARSRRMGITVAEYKRRFCE